MLILGMDSELQADEIQALSSIYGDDLVHELSSGRDQNYSMTIRNESVELRLFLKLPPTYPTSTPPTFEISSPYLDGKAKTVLAQRLQDIYVENLGQPILYHWFDACKRFLDEDRLDIGVDLDQHPDVADQHPDADQGSIQPQLDAPKVLSGDPLTDRKSTFQAHLAAISIKDQVPRIMDHLRSNPKIDRATHNMYAYRIHDGRICVQDCEDDGESQAGSRLLHLLEIMDARNVMVVVSRWYGGVHLGPDRFRHICNVARDILEKNGYGKQQNTDAKKGAKKK